VRALDRMLDYSPLQCTGGGGWVGLIKTISVACLQSNIVLSVRGAWNEKPYLLISNFLYRHVCVCLRIIAITTLVESSVGKERLSDGLLC
jgi:hypothetical protein